MEPFQIRIILLLMMFGVASVFDYKSRKIPDVIWIVFAEIGGMMYLFDYRDVSAYHVMSFVTSCFFGFMLYRFRFVGLADMFGIMAASVILPVHYGFVMVPILGTILALILVVSATILYNFSLNAIDMVLKRRRLFDEFAGEPLYRKFLVFFFIHRRREYEKFVISSENQYPINPKNRSFALISRNKEISQVGGLVHNAPPFIVFMMIGISLLLLPEILNMVFS